MTVPRPTERMFVSEQRSRHMSVTTIDHVTVLKVSFVGNHFYHFFYVD